MKKMMIVSFCIFILLLGMISGCSSQESQVIEQPKTTNPQVIIDDSGSAESGSVPTSAVVPKAEPAPVSTPKTVEVKISGFKFVPAQVTVKVGDTIKWTNQDSAPHTATANSGAFDTDRLVKGDSGTFTTTGKGTFPYICNIHPSMKGTVTVE